MQEKSPLQRALDRKQLDKMDDLPSKKLDAVAALKIKIESIKRVKL